MRDLRDREHEDEVVEELERRRLLLLARVPLPLEAPCARAYRGFAAAITASTSGRSRPSIQVSTIVRPVLDQERRARGDVLHPAELDGDPERACGFSVPVREERTSTPSDCAQAACDQTESREIARGRTPAAARSSLLSRRSRISFVQVGDQSHR